MFLNVSDVFSFSCFQRSACFPYVIPSAIFTRYYINDVFKFSSNVSACALSTGIAVNREMTSNDTIVSSSEMVILDISFLNCIVCY